jgi:hypothetical protein
MRETPETAMSQERCVFLKLNGEQVDLNPNMVELRVPFYGPGGIWAQRYRLADYPVVDGVRVIRQVEITHHELPRAAARRED